MTTVIAFGADGQMDSFECNGVRFCVYEELSVTRIYWQGPSVDGCDPCWQCGELIPSNLHDMYVHRSGEDIDIRMQMPVFYAWAHQPGVRIIECGTRGGYSACAFLAGIERAGMGGELWSVDIAPPMVPDWWHDLPFWHSITADSVSPEALAFCPDGVDILFCDTSHFYEQTLNELLAYAPKVRPGGIILIHDTDTIENGTAMKCPDMVPAIEEFCKRTGLTWYQHPGWNGLGVIEIPSQGAV